MSTPDNPMRLLPLLVAQSALSILSGVMYVPSFPALSAEFNAPLADVQATFTVYFLALALSQLLIGPLSDRMGRRPVMIAGLSLSGAAALACAFAPSLGFLIVARAAQAVGSAAGFVVTRAVVREIFPRNQVGRAMSYLTMGIALAPAAAPALGGVIQDLAGWRFSFIFIAVIAFGVLVLLYRKLPETFAPGEGEAKSFLADMANGYGQLLRDGSFLSLSLISLLTFGGLFAYTAVAPELIIAQLDYSPSLYGLLATLPPLGFMFGSFLSARLGRAYASSQLIEWGLMLQAAGGLIMLALPMVGVHHAFALVGPMTIWSVGMGLCLANLVVIIMGLFPAIAGTASALSGFLQTMGSSGGSGMMQALPHHTPALSAAVVLGTALLSIAIWAGRARPAAKALERREA